MVNSSTNTKQNKQPQIIEHNKLSSFSDRNPGPETGTTMWRD
jgi:hypothetical protein